MSPKTILVVDGGLFQPLAHLLAEHFERVLYFREWRNGPFVVPTDIKIGHGYEDIARVDSIMGCINDVDLFVMPDLFFAEEFEYLKSIGKKVFGAGPAEQMELWRDDFKAQMKELGMPTIPHVMVKGIKKLRAHLEEHENVYVKVSFVRGLKETFESKRYDLSKPDVDDMEHRLGSFSEDQEFMVEQKMPCRREVGSDQFLAAGRFPKTVQFAVEGKDKTALAMMRKSADLPKSVREINNAISPLLIEYDYCGPFSTEIRESEKDGTPYLIDPTCRCASPCGETYNLMCKNLGAMIEASAEGEIEEPDFDEPFAAQALICADMAETTSVPIWIDPKVRRNVALYNSAIREDGQEVVVFTDARLHEIGSLVATGKTIDAAIRKCENIAKKIECAHMSVYCDQLETFKKDLLK